MIYATPQQQDATQRRLAERARLHSPAHDTRLRECPECDGCRGDDCGVCLGDGYVWKGTPPPLATMYLDHSGLRHTCGRCGT